ncbi:MAG: DUF927 domain-containing protein [Ruminococcus sp.]|nr:DUF927 domain-containing protein [Ruminococcus sp.]
MEEVKAELLGDLSAINTYTRDDFLKTTAPYDFVYLYINNKFRFGQVKELVAARAKEVGVRTFAQQFKNYMAENHPNIKQVHVNFTEFPDAPIVLACGKYTCLEDVCFEDSRGEVVEVCNHPIMPVERIVNIDDNTEKLRLKYRKGVVWRDVIVEKEILASASKIVQLANVGIAVNSENAKYLVRYLTDMESLNYDIIPEVKSVGRLGWIKGYGFSPYVDDLVFDGEENFRHMFGSVQPTGDFFEWRRLAREVRKEKDPSARILLAASFASVLVEPCDCLPFFVHLWGGTESGKSVATLFACSVWASPVLGEYMKTFNATAVSQELTAGFLNSLPLAYDELQIVQSRKSNDDIVYKLCEGVGRDRGKKTGGLQKLSTWRNVILSTGETPISSATSGGGAINRVIEIECSNRKIISNPLELIPRMKENYGLAGALFVDWIQQKQENLQEVIDLRLSYMKKFRDFSDVTDKQAMAASLILTADELTERLFIQDGVRLTIDDLKPFLITKADVDLNQRCYDFLCDFVVANYAKFNPAGNDNYQGEIYGDARDDYVYIIKSKFDQVLTDNGYNPRAFLSWAAKKDLIKRDGRHNTVKHPICSYGNPRCVALYRADDDGFIEVDDDLPFP